MATIGSNLSDRDRIYFVSRHFQETASKWYTIVRDQTETCEQFKASFENRYWNIHTQREVRDQLEYGWYYVNSKRSMEDYIIQLVERCKHLTPSFMEHELVLKLSYYFDRHIRLAAYIQGVKIIEELLILSLIHI